MDDLSNDTMVRLDRDIRRFLWGLRKDKSFNLTAFSNRIISAGEISIGDLTRLFVLGFNP